MGFTVAEAKTFLASGHPAPGTDGPGHRGLIESTDGGRTFSTGKQPVETSGRDCEWHIRRSDDIHRPVPLPP